LNLIVDVPPDVGKLDLRIFEVANIGVSKLAYCELQQFFILKQLKDTPVEPKVNRFHTGIAARLFRDTFSGSEPAAPHRPRRQTVSHGCGLDQSLNWLLNIWS
jgi:hypothetical protein